MFDIIKTGELNIREIFATSFNAYKAKFGLLLLYSTIITAIIIAAEFTTFYLGFQLRISPAGFGTLNLTPFLINTFTAGTQSLVTTVLVLKLMQQESFSQKDILSAYKLFPKFVLTVIIAGFFFVLILLPAYFAITDFGRTGSPLFHLSVLFLLAVSFYAGVVFIFYINVLAHTGRWGLYTFLQSRRLVKGRWGKTFLVILILLLTNSIGMAVFGFVINLVSALMALPAVIEFAAMNVLFGYLNMYFLITISVWYFNRHALTHQG